MAFEKWVQTGEKNLVASHDHLIRMNNSWTLCGIGILFCVAGVYFFFKNVYEENQSVLWPVIIMIMGVALIVAGTAKYFKLID